MSKLSAFYPLIIPEVIGVTDPLVDLHLREVARDFCSRTSAWRMPFDDINLIAGQATYDLDTSEADSEVVRVTKITVNGELLWDESEDAPHSRRSHSVAHDHPKYLRTEPPFSLSPDLKEITLMADEVPTAVVTMKIVGAMKPTSTAATLPDFLRDQYSEVIRFGTMARLMAMGNKEWTDRPLAAAYESKWNQALGFAAYQAQVGNTRKPLRVKKW